MCYLADTQQENWQKYGNRVAESQQRESQTFVC
jgi:hypothetical protein